MHRFLDRLISPPISPSKRRAQTQTNSEILTMSQQERLKQEVQLDRKNSQPEIHQDNSNEEYQQQQITEQILFDQGPSSSGSQITHPSPSYHIQSPPTRQFIHSKQSSYARRIEPHLHKHNTDQQPVEVSLSYQNKQKINSSPQQQPKIINNHQSQKQKQPCIEQMEEENAPMIMSNDYEDLGRGALNFHTVETLINGINSAKESQLELLRWFDKQKQFFILFLQQVMNQINLQVKHILQKKSQQTSQRIQHQLRQQLQAQYQQKLQITEKQKTSKIQSNISKKQSLSGQSVVSMQRKWQIEKKLIKEELEQRYHYRIQKLQLQLQQQRKYSENLINTYQDNHRTSQSSNPVSEKNKSIHQELQFVKKQLSDRDKTIDELEMEVEKLNEHIFDIEQKIQGIELEVESRVRQRVKELEQEQTLNNQQHSPSKQQLNPILETSSHLEQSSRLFGFHSTNLLNSQQHQLGQVQLQNEHLKRIIQQLQEEKISLQLQLKQQDKIMVFRQEQVKKNEQDIGFEWSQIQRERQVLLNRQLELTTAEQNISRKISQIRVKQTHLEKLQTQLHDRQQGLNLRQQEIKNKLEQIVQRQNFSKQQLLRAEKQTLSNLSNTNNKSRKLIQDFNIQGGGSFRQNDVDIPELPIGRKPYQVFQTKHEKSFDNDYQFRNKNHDNITKTNFERSFEEADRSYTRHNRQRQRMVITSTNFRSTRPINNIHQYVLPQTSKVNHQSRSKSRSKQKSMLRSNLNTGSVASGYKNQSFKGKYIDELYQNKQSQNLDGLGSKLQRLREQIKREIESIK